jgi:hypothetical protein
MGVKFDLGNGTNAYIADNEQLVPTQRGMVKAKDVQQGDMICNVNKEPHNEVMSPPVVT